MAEQAHVTVTVRIMEREYQVACPEGERNALIASANYLNERMMAIRNRGKSLGVERIAVMASLNMARELMAQKGGGSKPDEDTSARLEHIKSRIDAALYQE
jgi:cell division protein ZapA